MKKLFLVGIILLFACACSNSYFKKIDLKTLKNKLEQKETFVLCLTDENDGNILKKTLETVSKKNSIQAYYLNTIQLNDNDLKSLKELFTFENTNIILFVKKGQEETVLSRVDNLYISTKELEQELINQGYIK